MRTRVRSRSLRLVVLAALSALLIWLGLVVVLRTPVQSYVSTVSEVQLMMADDEDDFTASWEAFCDELKLAGRSIAALSPGDQELDRAEGYRFLTRMIRLGLMTELEYVDPRYPQIWESETPILKSAANNPDELYHELLFDGRETYRIQGQRGTTPLIEFTVYEGRLGSDDGSRYVGHLLEDDLVVEADGSFEIVLSQHPHPGNWIRTTPGSNLVLIRQYRFDWDKEVPASMVAIREGEAFGEPHLRLPELRERLQNTSAFIHRSLKFWAGVSRLTAIRAHNQFAPPILQEGGEVGDTTLPQGHVLQPGGFALAEDEALVVEFAPPKDLVYWGFAVYNWWAESLDYRYSNVRTNSHQAELDTDGKVRIVVAHRDPGLANWVSTTGHHRGMMLLRWTRPGVGLQLPAVTVKHVKLSELPGS